MAAEFDQHVREQLPWYDLVTSAVAQIARHYVPPNGLVYDIGASQGNIGRALRAILDERGALLRAIEPSAEMCDQYQGPGTLECVAAQDYDFDPFDFGVAMLALMFVPAAEVPALLARVTANIRPGGALVVVERTLPPAGYMSIVTSRLTLAAKAAAGAPADQIIAKELSLAGVQRPVDPALLARFGAVEWFRFGDFAGYVIEAAA
ncbi:MAG: hypothetical protein ABWX71_06190 [Aeromicrobium sp.]